MNMKVQTAAGTYKSSYTGAPGEFEMDGEMQGKGDVMCIWTLISDSILRTHRKRCRGATLRHIAMELMTHRCVDAYVDDTDTLEQASENETMYTERQDSDRDPDNSEEEPIITDGVEEAVKKPTAQRRSMV